MTPCLAWALSLILLAAEAPPPGPAPRPEAAPLLQPAGPPPEPRATRAGTKEDLLNRLKLQEADLLVSQALAAKERYTREYREMERLFEEKTLTIKELNDAKKNMDDAELNYQRAIINLEKTRLDFLKDATHLTITQAKKYRTEDNERRVDITLRNNSNVDLARAIMTGSTRTIDDEALRNLLKVENIMVSLLDTAVIAEPYETIVPSLANGEQKTITFQLLKDVDQLEVRVKYLDTVVSEKVYLKKETIHELPTISSPQFAQEANLGSKVGYDINLEMLVENERNFGLVVVNLPKQIQSTVVDPKTRARVTQIKFTEETNKQQLRVELSIPEKLNRTYVDKPIRFSVFVTKLTDMKRIEQIRNGHGDDPVPPAELDKIPGNHADLQLLPRGVGQLEVIIANLYQEIKIGEKVRFQIQILNSGTLTMSNCETDVELPLNWNVKTDPQRVAEIPPGEKKPVSLIITPDDNVNVGNYDVKVKAKGEAGVDQAESTEKNFQVRVSAKSNILGSAILVTVLILIVLGIAIASIRISRH